jgi:hypothetical protein
MRLRRYNPFDGWLGDSNNDPFTNVVITTTVLKQNVWLLPGGCWSTIERDSRCNLFYTFAIFIFKYIIADIFRSTFNPFWVETLRAKELASIEERRSRHWPDIHQGSQKIKQLTSFLFRRSYLVSLSNTKYWFYQFILGCSSVQL